MRSLFILDLACTPTKIGSKECSPYTEMSKSWGRRTGSVRFYRTRNSRASVSKISTGRRPAGSIRFTSPIADRTRTHMRLENVTI